MSRCFAGWFTLLLMLLSAAGFAASPAPEPTVARESRWGLNLPAGEAPEAMLRQMELAASRSLRAVRVPLDWNRVEPRAGAFDWASYDRLVAAAKARGLEVVFVLGPTAEWASGALPTEPREDKIVKMPRQWSDWSNYVRAAVSHFRGQVKYWQIWEGFDFPNFRATRSSMITLIQQTRQAAKAADPEAKLILPEPGGVDLGWIAWLKTTPVWQQFDILGLRPYRQQNGALLLPLAVLQSEILAKDRKPVWIVGWAKGLAPNPTEANTAPADCSKTAFACGVERIFGEEPASVSPEPESSPLAPLDRKTALSRLQPSCLEKAVMDMNAQPREEGLYNLAYRTWPGGRLVEMSSGVHRVLGTSMQKKPLLCEADRMGDNPWCYFDVDDRFLFYTAGKRPIAITVECIGASGPETAGFNIYYDAGATQKFTPWQWIAPGVEKVYSYRLVLSDAWLANKDGYDFRINAKGSKEDIFITRVTVEPLPSPQSTP